MTDPGDISISDFDYHLPEERIALHPLPERDAAKLLIFQHGKISQDIYRNIDTYLPEETLLIFNNSKVIKARLRFRKSTGGFIEIFCLEPYDALNNYSSIMNTGSVKWKCMVGGMAKWKDGDLIMELGEDNIRLKATHIQKLPDAHLIEFFWMPVHLSFAEILEMAGDMPLPPYIKRHTGKDDVERYQTIYATPEGSVAAPTAGLHFTESIFKKLSAKNIETTFLTLHVGAGTFKPVKASFLKDHEMHAEWIGINIQTLRKILDKKNKVIAVGTTSLRTIESAYWMGVKVLLNPAAESLELKQWEIYNEAMAGNKAGIEQSFGALIKWMEAKEITELFTRTRLLITPGYRFKVAKGLVTNFHQPRSTLLLLVAAAVGKSWKDLYQYAMENKFRFLSYGDGNLIFIEDP